MIDLCPQSGLANDVITVAPDQSGYLAVLTDAEFQELSSIKSDVRRGAYAAARWLAKRLLNERLVHGNLGQQSTGDSLDTKLREIEILSRDLDCRPMRPVVSIGGTEVGYSISISHQRDRVFVVVSDCSARPIGCDLEWVRTLSQGFLELWFSTAERNWVAAANSRFPDHLELRQVGPDRQVGVRSADVWATAIWSAKEAAYKALNHGESFVPSRVQMMPTENETWRCQYSGPDRDATCAVSVKVAGNEIFAIATPV